MAESTLPSLSTIGVLREAVKTTGRNGKLVASILLIVFLSYSQLELGTMLALKSIEDQQPSSFEARGSSSFQRVNQQRFTEAGPDLRVRSAKRDSLSLYGYVGGSTPIAEARGVRSSQHANSGLYGYGDLRSSQKANPEGTYYDMGHSTPIEEIRDIHSSQRVNHGSYGYFDQSMHKSEIGGIRSSQNAKPGLYDPMGQFMPRVGVKVGHSAQRANPCSYSYMDQSIPLGEEVVRAYLGMGLLELTVSSIILLFFLIATISSSYEAHTAKVMSLKDLFLKFRESWKRPIHTSTWLTLISLGLLVLFIFFATLILILAEGSTAYILYAILIVSSTFIYLHMAVQWMISLVVSVLESDASGLKAINRAGELMKGKRIQASILMIIFHLAMGAVHMASNAITETLDGWEKMVITIPFTIGLMCILKLFLFAVYTVYYHDRKMSCMEDGAKGQVGLYVPITSDEA